MYKAEYLKGIPLLFPILKCNFHMKKLTYFKDQYNTL